MIPFDGDGKGKKGKGERKGLSCLANKEKGEEGVAEARKQRGDAWPEDQDVSQSMKFAKLPFSIRFRY